MISSGIAIILAVLLVAREIAARRGERQRLEELETLRSQAKQNDRLVNVGQLVSGLAQDLKSPLQGALGSAELLAASDGSGPDSAQELKEIRDNVTRAVGIVRNLLAFTETTELDRRWHDLNEVVREAVQRHRSGGGVAGDGVAFQGTTRLQLIYIDGRQVEKVLMTLLHLTVQASRRGKAADVQVTTRRVHTPVDHMVIDIDDPAVVATDDEPAWSGDLDACRRILQAHGGALEVEHRGVSGLRFHLELPVTELVENPRDMNKVIDFINVNRDKYLDELKTLLAIPSISALPEHAGDVKRCAEWCADEMRRIGMNNVRLIPTPGNPVVYGDWLGAPGAKTMLFYGHYDVQPVDPLNLWETPPFEATIRDGEIYARGSADDKGQVFMHFKAIEAHLKQNGKLPINIKIILEGEEEVGSVNLDNFIISNKADLKADVVVISDSPMFARGVPSICYGLRGLVYTQIDLRGASTDLHSGSFGGAVANPAFVLAQMIAQMKDRGGHIKVPGFYDDVVPLTTEERAAWEKLPFNEKQYRKDFGIPKLHGESGFSTLERTWARPTLEVNGLLSGFTGEGAKTVLPAVAMAKISMRLVPNQDPEKIVRQFEDYVKKLAPKTVDLKFTRMQGGKPWMTSFDNPYVQAASRAIEKGFNQTPVLTREGGSIPVVSTFQEVLGLPSVLFGVGLPDENAHAPNEKLDCGNFQGGIISAAYFYDELSRVAP